MDITLERILSLIPRKENGEFVHGALKDFAQSIGLKSGNLISDWIAGRSTSYFKKLHEIAAKYDVSVEWLRGETDEKKPAPSEGGQAEKLAKALDGVGIDVDTLSDSEINRIARMAKVVLEE